MSLADKYQNNNEQLYLALWRDLIHSLMDKQNDTARLGQLWELLPADTRIPDHSIWEHKRVTSAIAGALPKPAFLLFAIGPVQDFIATARKTQDLWAGSYLLSYLSWSAMKVVAEELGPDSLIFPDLCGQPFADKWLIDEKKLAFAGPKHEELSSPTLPNRFLAVVPEGMVSAIAGKAKSVVRETFGSVCDAVRIKIEKELDIAPEKWNAVWQRQTDDFIETYWAATPASNYAEFLNAYKKSMNISSGWEFDDLLKQYEDKGFTPNIGTLYSLIYKLTEKSLGSRKAIRDFKQIAEPNHKCTLCGMREPVHPGSHNDKSCSEDFGALRGFWQDRILPTFSQVRRSERLCAVCITKRLSAQYYFREKIGFKVSSSFPSVSMIATASFKKRIICNLNNPELATKANEFLRYLRELFKGNEDRMRGDTLYMLNGMCYNENAVSTFNRELAISIASLEGDWLYEDSFRDSLKDELVFFSDELLSIVKKSLSSFIKTAKKLGVDSPCKYYSVLLMDGDNMGKWLSGEYASTIADVLHPVVKNTLENDRNWHELLKQKKPLNPSLHLAASKALRDFSLHVAKEIVEKDHLGKLVYAGGDDVLAFVNLQDLLEVMRKLRAYFSGSLKSSEETNRVEIDFGECGSGFIPVDDKGDAINVDSCKPIKGFMLSMGTNATASMGVVIAHHNSNLSQVLAEVRKCEKEAKSLKDKNAFCVALAKRAGGTEHIKSKWFYKEPLFESIPLLRQWADAFYRDYISPKFVHAFRTETKGLKGLPIQAVTLELLRIADRQRNKKAKDFDKNKMVELITGLENFHKHDYLLDDLGRFLSLAAFLGREGNR